MLPPMLPESPSGEDAPHEKYSYCRLTGSRLVTGLTASRIRAQSHSALQHDDDRTPVPTACFPNRPELMEDASQAGLLTSATPSDLGYPSAAPRPHRSVPTQAGLAAGSRKISGGEGEGDGAGTEPRAASSKRRDCGSRLIGFVPGTRRHTHAPRSESGHGIF